MIINGYELKYSKEQLEEMVTSKAMSFELISKEDNGYQFLLEGDKKAIEHLVVAAKIMNIVSMEQDHPLNLVQKKALEESAKNSEHASFALKLFNSFGGVEGNNAVDAENIEIFKGISGLKGKNFYPVDMKVEEFHKILISMIDDDKAEEVRKILSSRTMVRRDGQILKAIDYVDYFSEEFGQIADELEKASKLVSDSIFSEYLILQAKAFRKADPVLDMHADMKWAEMQDTKLEFTVGRENYDDSMSSSVLENIELKGLLEKNNIEVISKDMIGIRVGIVNKEGTDLILRFKNEMTSLVGLMPLCEQYEQSIGGSEGVNQTMVDVDLIALTGDYAQCRGGVTTAQNLPNNDKLSIKNGGGRRNAYHRQVRQAVDKEQEKKILDKLVSKDLYQYYDSEAYHLFVIGHENGHSFGPNSSYQDSLGKHKHVIEELKADVVSLAFMGEYEKNGTIDKKTLYEVFLTFVVKGLFLLAVPAYSHPHRIAELIIFNRMIKDGVVSFDNDKKLQMDFDKVTLSMRELLKEVVSVQLSKSPSKADVFIKENSVWGKESKRIASFREGLGVKPYKILNSHF